MFFLVLFVASSGKSSGKPFTQAVIASSDRTPEKHPKATLINSEKTVESGGLGYGDKTP